MGDLFIHNWYLLWFPVPGKLLTYPMFSIALCAAEAFVYQCNKFTGAGELTGRIKR